MGTRKITLDVNDRQIELDYFVQRYIDHVVGGIVGSLQGTGELRTLDIIFDEDRIILTVNDKDIGMNPFVQNIIRNTITGMISSLKGVDSIINVHISIIRDYEEFS